MERLQKVMAHAGVASRRKCEDLIAAGRVTVNGKVVTELGTKVSRQDHIEVDQLPIYKEEPRYFVLYKPKNMISAVSDDRGRPVVVDLLQEVPERIYPIGRLDFDTTGLLLLTNDGDFAHLMMHPRHQVAKEYIIKIDGIPQKEAIRQLEKGVLVDGKRTSPAKAKLIKVNRKKGTAILSLVLYEGWNHQVKKMITAIGHNVMSLKRERLGNLTLDKMNPGDYRELRAFEVNQLRDLANHSG